MIRSLMLFVAALIVALPAAVRAQQAAGWVRVATAVIDARTPGVKVIALPDAAYNELRFTADKPITISKVRTSVEGVFKTSSGTFALKPGVPSASFIVNRDAVVSRQVEITWAGDASSDGAVNLTIWGLGTQGGGKQADEAAEARRAAQLEQQARAEQQIRAAREAESSRQRDQSERYATKKSAGPNDRTGATRGYESDKTTAPAPKPVPPAVKAAPPPPQASAPATRGLGELGGSSGSGGSGGGSIGAAPPPAPPSPAPKAAPPPATEGSRPDVRAASASNSSGSNVCTDTQACTMVDVYFGTNRSQVKGPERISFSGERTNNLVLGHSFVTVPKTNRARGTISRPWQETYLGLTVQGDPKVHFTIPKNGVKVYASEADFLAEAKAHIANAGEFKDHAFIYVHGFAVTFENAVYRAAQISYDLSTDGNPFGTAFVFTWPSKGSILPTAYAYDQDSADSAADHLRAFINLVTEKTGVANVHIIAHSMGNRVLMNTLERISLSGSKARINQIVLAAPDVDKQQFESLAVGIGRLAKGITLYASNSDNALVLSRKLRGGAPRAGEVFNPPGPAIVAGIDTVDISALSTSIFDFGHDTYADSTVLLADIAKIFVKGDHPPTKRNDRFKLLSQGTLEYWRYAK